MTSDSMNRFEQEHLKQWWETTHGDGQAAISSFATLQNSCLSCHQSFRKPFVEYFYAQH